MDSLRSRGNNASFRHPSSHAVFSSLSRCRAGKTGLHLKPVIQSRCASAGAGVSCLPLHSDRPQSHPVYKTRRQDADIGSLQAIKNSQRHNAGRSNYFMSDELRGLYVVSPPLNNTNISRQDAGLCSGRTRRAQARRLRTWCARAGTG